MQVFATRKATAGGIAIAPQLTPKYRRAVRIMKLSAILLFAFCMQLSARGLTQTVTIHVKDAPIQTVIQAIEKQTGYVFFYNTELLKQAKKVTLTVNNLPLQQVLDEVFRDQPLGYTIAGKNITISVKEGKKNSNVSNKLIAPPLDIKGRIVNENGDPVLATITVKGATKGTNTNENGEFHLTDVEDNSVLVITGVGIESKELKVNGNSILNVIVKISVTSLEETIIKGYYVTSKRLNTGNVTKVTSKDISSESVLNPLQAIKARVPGLQIIENTGMPGSNFTVKIRGQNSLRNDATSNGNNPLYVIDGVPFISGQLNISGISPYPSITSNPSNGISPLSTLNSYDIESIEVLKDADATAIYGSRGANGVILITTKKGQVGQMRVNASFYTGVGQVTRKMDLLNTEQYLEMRREAKVNDNRPITSSDFDINGAWDTTMNSDWQKVLIGNTAKINDAQLGLSGGTANVQYLFNGGFHKETTVFPGDNYNQRASAHFSLNATSPDQKFKINFSGDFSHGITNLLGQDLTTIALRLAPDAPALYDSTGGLNWQSNTFANPLAYKNRPYDNKVNNLITNLILSYKIADGLTIQSSFGLSNITVNEKAKILKTAYDPATAPFVSLQTTFGSSSQNTWIIEPQINYRKKFGEGTFHALVGSTFQNDKSDQLSQNASGFLSEDLMDNISAATQSTITSTYLYSKYKYNAIYGRLGYDWKSRYLINLTGRRDGSSRFGPGNQFANFEAVGLAWIFSSEKFIQKSLRFLSFGKLRTSYGTTGSDQIPNYGFLDGYTTTNAGQYQTVPGIIPARLYNPNFRWEINKKIETSLDLGFFNDRIFLNIVYYQNRSSNQLVGYTLPGTTGFTSIQANLDAVVQNNGWEIAFNSTNIKMKELAWYSGLNFSVPRNKLISFPGLETSTYSSQYVIDQPLSIYKLYHFLGVDPQTGVYKIEDVDNNGIYNASDRETLRNIAPKYYGGFANHIVYRSFSLDFLFQFVKQLGFNYLYFTSSTPGANNYNQPVDVLNRWRKPGDEAQYQVFNTARGIPNTQYSLFKNSDALITDASFIRLKNLSFSYNFSETILKNLKIKQARIFIQGQNLVTITNYKGIDPENQYLGLPPLRVWSAGVSIGL